jgi:hypothetical protein
MDLMVGCYNVCVQRMQWFTGGYPTAKLRTDVDPSDGASPGTAWTEAEAVDKPRRAARGMALPATTGDWTTHGKVSTRHIHGPRRTCLTRSKALDRSEEGG